MRSSTSRSPAALRRLRAPKVGLPALALGACALLVAFPSTASAHAEHGKQVARQLVLKKSSAWEQPGKNLRRRVNRLSPVFVTDSTGVLSLSAPISSAIGSAEAAGASDIGQWEGPFGWPLVAVNMVLQPNGKVLVYDAWGDGPGSERLWDPSTGGFTAVPQPRNLFCSGHVVLADGRTLVLGGHTAAYDGTPDIHFFDSSTSTWTRGPDMSVGRWYPTGTTLADGRVLAFAGDNVVQDRPSVAPPFSDASVDSLPSIYNPRTNAWTDLEDARLTSPLYPFLFVLSDGRVLNAGPDMTTRTLNTATATWSTVGVSPIDGHSAVMYRPNKIMKSGTWADPDFNGTSAFNSGAGTAVIDMDALTPTWRSTAPMARGRSYHNMILLPDGTVLASGGMSGSDGTDETKAVLPAEIWNPDSETWTTAASLTNPRLYHSTAMLLRDGRVLMAGGGALPGRATDQKNAEIYSPPYLFKGARPTITLAPATLAYGSGFSVGTPDASRIASISLVRTGAVTHSFDQNQRFMNLSFVQGSGELTVQAPPNSNVAPPGPYMLFLVDTNGVPSVASFVRLANASSDPEPPTAPTGLSATATVDGIDLSWSASTDNVGVFRYSVHRSATAGFTPSDANRIAHASGTTYRDSGRTPGTTYHYRVLAEDSAGNVSASSNEVSATAIAPVGLVAAFGFDEGSGASVGDLSGSGNGGTVSGASWSAAGRFGKALSFDGVNDWVTVADANSLDLVSAMTLEAWVRPTANGASWRTVLFKEMSANVVYGLYSNTSSGRPGAEAFVGSGVKTVGGSAGLALNTWSHLAASYDGAALRLYVNGALAGSLATTGGIASSSGALRIGGNSVWGEYFAGLIDEVRVYSRALSQSEIQTDMNRSVATPDTSPPTPPGTLTATGSLGQAALSWGASSDNVGVKHYNVHRSPTAGFTPSASNRIAQPTGTSYTDSGMAAGTYHYKLVAEDAAGNLSVPSNEASAAVTADTSPPIAPSALSATGGAGQSSLAWTAASDNVAVKHYNVHRSTTAGFTPSSSNRVAQPTGTSYTDGGLAAGTFYYRVVAEDAAGNLSAPSNEASATVAEAPPIGLVAAYGFDEGTGTSVADLSGSGNGGTISGASWSAAGKFGKALSFDGVNDLLTVADSSSLDLTSGMTLEAWVRPTSNGSNWRTVVLKETAGNLVYGLYSNTSSGRPAAEALIGGGAKTANGSAGLTLNAWSHLAASYDGTALRLYVNGTSTGSLSTSGAIATSTRALRIGGNSVWGEYFGGLIDELRIYNRALSQGEIQTDMNRSVGTPDTSPPSAPGTLSATGSLGQAALNWGASSDNVGVKHYNVHRSTTAGFTSSSGNRIAQATGTSYTDSGLASGTYHYKVVAEDAAGNLGPASNEASATVTADTTPPTAPSGITATGAAGQVSVGWAVSFDDVGVKHYNVHRSTSAGFTPSSSNRVAQPTGTSYTDGGLAAGTFYYKVVAEDAAGNLSAPSNEASATVTEAPPVGLVAAFGFDEGVGTSVGDLSGSGNGGTLSGASWSAAGRFGKALSFDGVNDWVTVADSSSLDLASAMTLEAWVRPSANGTSWRTVLFKETGGNLVYGLYSNTSSGRPAAEASIGSGVKTAGGSAGLALNTWSHVAASYDGAALRLYVNGALAGSLATAGGIATSSGSLRIGGNAVWGEYFAGLIDEVRVYNRALSQSEIQTDSNRSVGTPDTKPPTKPGTLTATGSLGQAALSWGASSDNVGVKHYNVHRSTTAGFTPSASNRIAQPTGTSYTDSGLAAGTYHYKVVAEDAAGNLSAASNEASAAVTADTTPPTAPSALSATGSAGQSSLAWTGSSDNVGVKHYNVHRSSSAGFTPSALNRVAQPTGTSYTDSGLAAGTYYYKIVAEDASGNVSAPSNQASANVTEAPPVGLVAAYGFDEGSGTSAADASGSGNGGTVSGASWSLGRFGKALSFDGVNDWVTVADANSLDLTSAMTLEAWVRPTANGTSWRTVVFKETAGNLVYGVYSNTSSGRPAAEAFIGSGVKAAGGSAGLTLNTWSHLAATYDGAALRLYVNGTLAGSLSTSGGIETSTGALRIGGNSVWGEYFAGLIDEVRVYNRALSASEIQTDMARAVVSDATPPTVLSTTPAAGSSSVAVTTAVKATFSEPMDPATIDGQAFSLRDGGGNVVAGSVTYDENTGVATLTPAGALSYGTAYTATIEGGATDPRAKDRSGNALAADHAWTFTTDPVPGPILLLRSAANGFSSYPAEILRAEGLNAFASLDVGVVSRSTLNSFDIVIVGDVPLTAAQVTMLTDWVSAGGNLIALRPDKQLAGLLGLSDAAATLANGYLRIDTSSQPGAGLVPETIQFHGVADRYTLNGARAVATLYSNANTATSNPAVTVRGVGTNGGQAAAFTYDLARSVVYTRQGNPAWSGQERDGVFPIRPNDLFYGAAAGDPQPDWVDLNKIAIPQADEQQRLLVNLILMTNRERTPLPRFWYLPRGEDAVVVMTGDDHAFGGTAGRFDQYKAASAAGCSVADWGCVRSTSYIYPNSPLTNAQAAQYEAEGFEVAVHVANTFSLNCGNWTPTSLESAFAEQLASFGSKYTSAPAPTTERTHCVAWSDWVTHAEVEANHGIRLDTNYYHYPSSWIGSRPGFLTGSGLPMRFADVDGTVIDVFQAATQMTDEAGQEYPSTVDALLDKALGPEGYYGVFTANMHTDEVASQGSDAIVASAQARGVPTVSARQILQWTDGRDRSSFRSFSWSGGTLGFTIDLGPGANGLEAMLPVQSASGNLLEITRGGTPVAHSAKTIKGVQYAVFPAVAGAYAARYG